MPHSCLGERADVAHSCYVRALTLASLLLASTSEGVEAEPGLHDRIARGAATVQTQVIAWRQRIHEHPELANREVQTSRLVAAHLRTLGLGEIHENVAHTGVIGVLRGSRPGPTIALRADMDALPVTETTGLPYASRVRSRYEGAEVGVMHACGHDAHTAMLMGAAQVLTAMRDSIAGTILFVFQPAEEGAPSGEQGGARLMLEEGAFKGIEPEAVFGLHVGPGEPGRIYYRPGGLMAGSDEMKIVVKGRQTHAAFPWLGVDPITVAGQIVSALQVAVAREIDVTRSTAVVSIGSIHGGVRSNIIPDEVTLGGTVRALDPATRDRALDLVRRHVEHLAAAAGATATVEFSQPTPAVFNSPQMIERILPSLRWAADNRGVEFSGPKMASDDFAVLQQAFGGGYFFLGASAAGQDPAKTAPNHSPNFTVNDDALLYGVRALVSLATDYLNSPSEAQR